MPRKRFDVDSGPRRVGDCPTPDSVDAGQVPPPSQIFVSGLGWIYSARVAAAGQFFRQLFRENTGLAWTQAFLRFGRRTPTAAELYQSTIPAGYVEAIVAANEGNTSSASARVTVTPSGVLELPEPTTGPGLAISFPDGQSWNSRLWSFAYYIDENLETYAESEAEAFQNEYCTEHFPTVTAWLPGGGRHGYEVAVGIYADGEELASFVDMGFLSAISVSAILAECDGDVRVGALRQGGDGSGSARHLLNGLLWAGNLGGGFASPGISYQDFGAVATAGNPPKYTSTPVSAIGITFIRKATNGALLADGIVTRAAGAVVTLWKDGEQVDEHGVTYSADFINPSVDTLNLNGAAAEDGAYRLRARFTGVARGPSVLSVTGSNQAVFVGEAESAAISPPQTKDADYDLEFSWVQKSTRPRIAFEAIAPEQVGQLGSIQKKRFRFFATEPLSNVSPVLSAGGVVLTRNGSAIGSVLLGDYWHESLSNGDGSFGIEYQDAGPGVYQAVFTVQGSDVAGNAIHQPQAVEWIRYELDEGQPPPIYGQIDGLSGVAKVLTNSATLRFSSPVVGMTASAVSLSVNGGDPVVGLQVSGSGDTYTITGLAEHHEPGDSYLLSVSTSELSPADEESEATVIGPVRFAWVAHRELQEPPEVDAQSTSLGMIVIGDQYSVSAAGSVATIQEPPANHVNHCGYGLATDEDAAPAFIVNAPADLRVSSASVEASLQKKKAVPTEVCAYKGSNSVFAQESLVRAVIRDDRLYNDPHSPIYEEDIAGLGHSLALTGEFRHAQWSSGDEFKEIEIDISAEDFREHPLYEDGDEFRSQDELTEYWAVAGIEGTYTLGDKIDEKQLAPCQYYFGGEADSEAEPYVVQQEPPILPKCFEIEGTDELSLDEDWRPYYLKSNLDEPNNVPFDDDGFFVGWQHSPFFTNVLGPVPPVPPYLAAQRATVGEALFWSDGELSRAFVESLAGSLPVGSTQEECLEWHAEEMGTLSGDPDEISFTDDFGQTKTWDGLDTRTTGTAKKWNVSASIVQAAAWVSREVPLALSRCGEVNGVLGLLRVGITMRVMYTIEINPARRWTIRWRARHLADYVAQQAVDEGAGMVFSTQYAIVQARRIIEDPWQVLQSRTTKRERSFDFKLLLTKEEAGAFEAGEWVERRVEIQHAGPAPQQTGGIGITPPPVRQIFTIKVRGKKESG